MNKVVLRDELMSAARQWADRLKQGPAFALAMTKTMINNEWSMDLASAISRGASPGALADGRGSPPLFRGFQKQAEAGVHREMSEREIINPPELPGLAASATA